MAIPVGYEFVPYLAIGIHATISSILAFLSLRGRKERTKYFPILYGLNLALFVSLFLVVSSYLEMDRAIDFLAFIAYSVLGSYVVTIEIPGFILLTRYDEKLSEDLQIIRRGIISLNYESGTLKALESKTSSIQGRLRELFLDDVVGNFVESYKRMSQIDKTLYDVALKELGESIQYISTRSKHPFPKLIEILSLAGISFLIGQSLNHFLP